METFLRNWRQDALNKHQYDSAIFVGDKLLALTKSDEDAFALAQTHFSAGNHTRALSFIARSETLKRTAAAKYLAAHCYVKQNKHEDALGVLGDKNPVHLITTTDAARRKIQHLSNEQSKRPHGKSRVPKHTDRADRSEERDHEDASSIKYEAGMCYLRGLCFAKQNAFDRAKECYKDAVRIDIQCFEAFDALIKNSLLSPGEEWDFLESLDFDSIPPDPGSPSSSPLAEAADFTRNLYTMRLSKYTRPDAFTSALETLSTHYRLSSNPDLLLARAELLFTSSRHQAALALTNEILELDPYNFACLPLHLALLHHLSHLPALFSLAHDLADTHPSEPGTWLAVGTYYLATSRIPEARGYFSKASLMDPHFGPAWIGFAHTFAAEGEADQAIAAYSTAARLFQGTHLPPLFLGMQEAALGNLGIARDYLTAAYGLCRTDPLLLNEIGVLAYLEHEYGSAAGHFAKALRFARENGADGAEFVGVRVNLAHALRKGGRFEEALGEFEECVRLGMREAGVFAAKGLVLLEMDQPFEATVALHEALAISPQDPIASELLNRALELLEDEGVLGGADESAVDEMIRRRVKNVRGTTTKGGGPIVRRKRRLLRQSLNGMDLDGAVEGDHPFK